MVIGVGFLCGCNEQHSSNEETSNDNNDVYVPLSRIVTYKVTGSAESVSITYTNYDGGTSQYSLVYLPWDITFYSMKSGDFVYISAQNNGEYGSVKAEIYVDGALFKTSSSYGAYVIASSSGII